MDRLRAATARIDAGERTELAKRIRTFDVAQDMLQKRIVVLQVLLILLLIGAFAALARAYLGWQRTFRRERDMAARQEAIFDAARRHAHAQRERHYRKPQSRRSEHVRLRRG